MSGNEPAKVEELLAAAKAASGRNDWAQAKEICDSALQTFAKHPLAKWFTSIRATALTNLGCYAEAETDLNVVVQDMPDKPLGYAGLARVAQSQQEWSLASQRWDECIRRFPASPDTLNWRKSRARVLEKLGTWREASESWDGIAKEFEGDKEAPAGRARCLQKLAGLAREGDRSPAKPAASTSEHSRLAIELQNKAKAAAQRKDWNGAIALWDACLAAFPDSPSTSWWKAARASILAESGRHGEAEAAFNSLAQSMPEKPYGFTGLARLAQSQKEWKLASQRWDFCIEKFSDNQEAPNWRRSRAKALEKLGAWQEAFEAWNALATEFEADREALVGVARCLLKIAAPTLEVEQSLARALQAYPRDPTALRMSASMAVHQDDTRVGLNRWLDYLALQPKDDVEAYRLAISFASLCGDRDAAARVIAFAPKQLAESASFRSRVLLPFLEFQRDIEAGLKLQRELRGENIDWRDGVSISDFLLKTLNYKESLDFLSAMLERYPDNPTLLRNYLHSVFHSGGIEQLGDEKKRLRAELGDAAAAQFLSILPKSWLTPPELKLAIDHLLGSIDANSEDVFLALHIADSNDSEVIDYLSRRLEALEGPHAGAVRRIILSKIRDSRRIAGRDWSDETWDEMKAESRSLDADLNALVRQQIEIDLPAPSFDDEPFAEAVFALQRIEPRACAAWLNSSASYYDAASPALWLRDRIAKGEPTSVVRLGDGEGNFLPYPPAYANFQNADRREIQQQMWGEVFFSDSEAQTFTEDLAAVALRADVVGITTLNRLFKAHYRASQTFQRVVRGWHNVLHFFDGVEPEIVRNKIIVSSNLHSDLHSWDLYRLIFQSVSSVSIVSCHDLSPFFAEQFGVSVRCRHLIPAQKKHINIFGHADTQADDRFYPKIFNRIMADLAPEPGEVFVIAAGILGKFMCDRIRAKGGIALDIGSLADYWMGYSTREYGKSQLTPTASDSAFGGRSNGDRL
jgi:tetratricopeptide (TPR) repeat protein